MKITGGSARGRVVRQPVLDGVRPTSSRVREALFSIVGQDLSGQRVLDAFGGAGLLGLEAWSRGADVVIVEQRRHVVRTIRETASSLGATVAVEQGDVLLLAPGLGGFDGALCDPPYAVDAAGVLAVLGPLVRSWLLYESDASRVPPDSIAGLSLDRVRVLGGTALWLYLRVAE